MADFPPVSAPLHEKWERLADEWPVVEGPEFADGGKDYFSPTLANPIRRWRVTYRGKTPAAIAPLDTWHAANRGSGLTFNFTDRDSTVYGGVRCVRYVRGHARTSTYAQFREIEFEDRPG
jgi:hypothetical protein